MITRRLSSSLLVTVIALSLLLAVPAVDGVGAATKPKVPLVGTNWALTARTALGVPLRGAAVSAQFTSDGRLSGQVACNRYSGSYEVDGSRLKIPAGLVTTNANCTPVENAVSRVYLARLPRVRSFTISGTTLTLFRSGDRALLTYRASGADDLIRRWEVTSYYTGTAVQSVVTGSTLTAGFTRTSVAGDGGCNRFNGMYTTSGATIDIGPLASTLRACADAALTTQEQHYLAALELATSFRVTGSKLELLRDGGTLAVTFDRT